LLKCEYNLKVNNYLLAKAGEIMWSPTYGRVSFDRMYEIVKDFVCALPEYEYEITIGSDSQNHELTKTVLCVAVWRKGKGGIYFTDTRYTRIITNIRQKLIHETSLSLDLALRLTDRFKEDEVDCNITAIHVDAGNKGPTSRYISEIVGWVKACGFDCKVKPESYCASSIADRASK
jgi:predicted RNase H-related nuclease YkuK (DUF458 family)